MVFAASESMDVQMRGEPLGNLRRLIAPGSASAIPGHVDDIQQDD
jgi:hypothetical protein